MRVIHNCHYTVPYLCQRCYTPVLPSLSSLGSCVFMPSIEIHALIATFHDEICEGSHIWTSSFLTSLILPQHVNPLERHSGFLAFVIKKGPCIRKNVFYFLLGTLLVPSLEKGWSYIPPRAVVKSLRSTLHESAQQAEACKCELYSLWVYKSFCSQLPLFTSISCLFFFFFSFLLCSYCFL